MRIMDIYDRGASKKATNLTVNSDLLAQAKSLGINISALLERALSEQVRALKSEAWLRENREAIEAYNQDVEAHGAFSDGFRAF